MSKLRLGLLLLALGGGLWYYLAHYETEIGRGAAGLEYVKIRPRGQSAAERPASAMPPAALRPSIRIASFNLTRLDDNKLAAQHVADALAKTIAQFDLVAVQDIRAPNQGVLVRLVERINAAGRSFDFAVCPTVLREDVGQYRAFIFDQSTIEVDYSMVNTVKDPGGHFRHKPLVGAFRARGPKSKEAFTFTLVNIQTDRDRAAPELDVLDDVYRAVRNDGRNEDDVILLGDLAADPEQLAAFARTLGVACAITGTPTTTRGTALADNILFDRRATVEFAGRSGVLDLMRQFGLTMPEALEVSEHLPVWAEFSPYEGGQAGRVPGI